MNTIKQLLITIAVLLYSATANAQSFKVDGIYYNILSDEDMTVEVSNGKSYSGDINILKNFTLPTHYYKSWESTNHSNSTTSETSYILDVEAGDILTFDWSVSSDDYDYLIITLDGTKIIKKSGALSGNYNKTFNSAGTHTLVIKYTKDYSYTWGNDIGKIYNVQLKSSSNKFCYTTTSIGKDAFYNCTGLTSITIPNSVTTIGVEAFYGCSSLTSIEIPNSVTTIGKYAFYGCSGLTSITIPNSVTTIERQAFSKCTSLTSIEIPNSVTTIGPSAFEGCSGLKKLTIGKNVEIIGNNAFNECTKLKDLRIEDGEKILNLGYCTSKDKGLFYSCPLRRLYLGRNLSFEYNFSPFYDKKLLASVTISNSVTTICEYELYGCTGLTSIEIPNSVTTIGDYAFYGCSGLTSITIPNSVTTIGDYAFYWCPGLTSIEIPNSATTIGDYAFSYCTITSIEIPNSVTRIGERAFLECTGLTSIVVAEDNTIYDSREDCNAIIETATNTLISGCKNTIIPNSVTTIGNSAFMACSSLTSVKIGNSVTTIGDYAFSNCKGLTSIEIPNCVTTIGDYAFNNCDGLTSVRIGNSVTTIGNSAFSGCTSLTSIEIPNSVTTIGDYTFYHCEGLTSIEIPNSVTTIGEWAFSYCDGLTSITIPNSVTTIGERAFYLCNRLTSVTSLISANELFSIGNNVFKEVDKNACTLYVPYGAKETYEGTDGWNKFTNIVEMKGYDLTVSAAGYATLYLDFNAEIPEGVEVYTASNVDGNRLMMQQVTGVLPANTGVIVRAEQGTYTFEQSFEETEAIENNLLRGSVEDEYITPEKGARYYVLAMKDGVVGMYKDALSGGTFKNNANKAYLQLKPQLGIYDEEVDTENPGMQLSNRYYFDFSGTTAIEPVINKVEDNIYYDLSGRRVENPTRGIYILNGKKILVK
ncbi:MAG: leucine-rich repeat domain-containing protein [Bacteroidaceae bacterium]|nr:leucine-rich repeat domain-containing protein [Bacteroidaceae bacterium]